MCERCVAPLQNEPAGATRPKIKGENMGSDLQTVRKDQGNRLAVGSRHRSNLQRIFASFQRLLAQTLHDDVNVSRRIPLL